MFAKQKGLFQTDAKNKLFTFKFIFIFYWPFQKDIKQIVNNMFILKIKFVSMFVQFVQYYFNVLKILQNVKLFNYQY